MDFKLNNGTLSAEGSEGFNIKLPDSLTKAIEAISGGLINNVINNSYQYDAEYFDLDSWGNYGHINKETLETLFSVAESARHDWLNKTGENSDNYPLIDTISWAMSNHLMQDNIDFDPYGDAARQFADDYDLKALAELLSIHYNEDDDMIYDDMIQYASDLISQKDTSDIWSLIGNDAINMQVPVLDTQEFYSTDSAMDYFENNFVDLHLIANALNVDLKEMIPYVMMLYSVRIDRKDNYALPLTTIHGDTLTKDELDTYWQLKHLLATPTPTETPIVSNADFFTMVAEAHHTHGAFIIGANLSVAEVIKRDPEGSVTLKGGIIGLHDNNQGEGYTITFSGEIVLPGSNPFTSDSNAYSGIDATYGYVSSAWASTITRPKRKLALAP